MNTRPLGSAEPTAQRQMTNAWYVLVILLILHSFNYADRFLIAALAEPMKLELGLSDSFVGMLMGPAFAVLYTIFSIPLARLADRTSRIMVICGGCVVWSVFTILSGFATTGWMLALMRIGVGIGEAAFIAPAYAMLADSFSPNRRGVAFALFGLGIYLGQMGGYIGGPAIAVTEGWRGAFIWVGGLGACIAVLGYLTIYEPSRKGGERKISSAPPLLATVRQLWRRPTYWRMNLGVALGSFSGTAFGMWAPSLFVRNFDVTLVEASAKFGLAFSLAGLTGMFLFGAVADRLTTRDISWPLRLSALSLTCATTGITLATLAPSLNVVLMIAVPTGIMGGGWVIGALSSLQRILDGSIRSTGVAVFNFVTTFAGLVFGPFFVGLLSDAFGGGADGIRNAMLVAISPGLIGAWLFWSAARTLKQDAIEI